MKKSSAVKEKKSLISSVKMLLPGIVLFPLITIWFCLVLTNYLKTYSVNLDFLYFFFSDAAVSVPFSLLGSYAVSLSLVFVLFFSAFGYGRIVADLISKDLLDPDEWPFLLGAGLIVIISVILIMGSFGLLYRSVIGSFVCVGVVYAVYLIIKKRKITVGFSFSGTGILDKLLFLLTIILLIFTFIGALSPETFFDSLKYHLSIPQYWVQHHRISAIEHFEYSYYPVNIHSLFIYGLLFGNEITCKLIHFFMGILCALLVYTWTKKRFSNRTALAAAVFIFSVPFVEMVMWKTAIEMGLAFFETLSVLSLVNYLNEPDGGRRKNFWLAASGIFCGAAIGGKYLSIYALAAMFCSMFVYLCLNKLKIKKMVIAFAVVSIVPLVMVSPYLYRNYKDTGLMTYPYGIGLKSDITTVVKSGNEEFSDPGKPDRSLKNLLTLPWDLTMGKKTQEPISGPIWLLLLPFLFVFRKIDKRISFLLLYFASYYLCWFSVRTYFRYIIPLVPAASIVFAYYIFETGVNKYFKNLILIVLIIPTLSTLSLVISTEYFTMCPAGVVSGAISKKDYLSTNRQSYPSPYYQVIDWANANLPANSKIFFLGETRGYYSKNKFVTYTISDINPLSEWIKDSKSAGEIYKELKNRGITHILLNVPEARRLATYDMIGFDFDQLNLFSSFWKIYIKEIYKDIADVSAIDKGFMSLKNSQPEWWKQHASDPRNYVYLYEIMNEEEAFKPHNPPVNMLLTAEIHAPSRLDNLQNGDKQK